MRFRLPSGALGWQLRAALPLLCSLLLCGNRSASAQTTVGFHGYVKNLGIASSSTVTGKPYYLDVGRFRAKGLLHAGSRLSAEIWVDTEVLFGSFLETDEFAQSRALKRPRLLDLDWRIASGSSIEIRQQLFRAFGTLYVGQTQWTLGRQRIAWGTGFAWNPTDIINPFNPGAIELGERAGADAVYGALQLDTVSRLEVVAALGDHFRHSTYATRFGTHYGEYDLSVMCATTAGDWIIGGDFAGYLGTAGLRGEVAFTQRDEGRGFVRAVLNADYSIAKGPYILVEVYYNGQGHDDPADYDFEALIRGESYNLARRYAAASLAAPFTPLVGGAVYALGNLDDGSTLMGPSVTVSVAENMELAASAYFFLGANDTEYGAQHHVFFASLQWYF